MAKSIAKITAEEEALLKEWHAQTGQSGGQKVNKIVFDNSKIDGKTGNLNENFGKMFAYKYEGDAETKIEIPIGEDLFLVKCRMQVKCKDVDNEGKAKYWCREEDDPNCFITLFDENKNEVVSDMYRNLKDQYNLKYTDAAYIWYKGDVYRWIITGAHFESWFEVKKKAFKDIPMYFKISGMTEEKTGSIFYKALQFELTKPFPIAQAIEVLKGVNDGLANYYASIHKKALAAPMADDDEDKMGEPMLTDLPY